jgi:methyl-accepting chemotaxis protein
MKSVTTRCILTSAALDVLFGPVVAFAYFQLLGPDNASHGYAIFFALIVARLAFCSWLLRQDLRPVEAFARAKHDRERDALVRRADAAIQGLPLKFSCIYALTWLLIMGGTFAVMRFIAREHFALMAPADLALCLVLVAVSLGSFALTFPVNILLLSDSAGQCALHARRRSLDLERPSTSVQQRLGVIALALGTAPMIWMVAVGYMAQVTDQVDAARARAEAVAFEVSTWRARSETPLSLSRDDGASAYLLDAGGVVLAQVSAQSAHSGLMLALSRTKTNHSEFLKLEGVAAAVRHLPDGGRALAIVALPTTAGFDFLLGAGVFAIVVVLWAPLCALALARAISVPIEKLTGAVQRIVEEGNQSQMGTLEVIRNDEIGVLSDRFNDLLDMMRDLSRAADSIARGDLRVSVEREGELPDAFRRMIDGLRAMVSSIRGASYAIATTATEMFAASQEQEAAATSQSSAMTEISHTMESLSSSAAHVSEAVQGVLNNAEQTLVTTDAMVEHIEGLSVHAGRIAELLDVIRDIADRSDLLALNGSLEASRAGEGGQGFALVAGEMRRLAERVTASVHDVKKLVSDIRESSSSTIMATEEGRRLARSTTEAARRITLASQQQRSGTEQVTQSVRDITDVVTQAAAVSSQTRTSARSLKEQADLLSNLVRQFEVSSEAA